MLDDMTQVNFRVVFSVSLPCKEIRSLQSNGRCRLTKGGCLREVFIIQGQITIYI